MSMRTTSPHRSIIRRNTARLVESGAESPSTHLVVRYENAPLRQIKRNNLSILAALHECIDLFRGELPLAVRFERNDEFRVSKPLAR